VGQRDVERFDERGRRDARRIQDVDVGMRCTQMWRDVLVEQRRHYGERASHRKQGDEHLEVALVAVVDDVDGPHAGQIQAVQRVPDGTERRLRRILGAERAVAQMQHAHAT
jgi:hypothetical protein